MVKVTFDTFYSGKTTVLINKGRYAENKTTALIVTCDDPQKLRRTMGHSICKSWNQAR